MVRQQQALFAEAEAALKAGDLATYQAKVNQARASVTEIATVVLPPTSDHRGGDLIRKPTWKPRWRGGNVLFTPRGGAVW